AGARAGLSASALRVVPRPAAARGDQQGGSRRADGDGPPADRKKLERISASLPRKRESRGHQDRRLPWMPAFAGMTELVQDRTSRRQRKSQRSTGPRMPPSISSIIAIWASVQANT